MKVRHVTNTEYNESPSHDREIASGRATCRFCGLRIEKGHEDSIAFYPAFDGGCNWQRVTAHVHLSCVRARGLTEK